MTSWRVNEKDGHVYQHDGDENWPPPRRLATVYSPDRRKRAHLIAAAPDLLEALKDAHQAIEACLHAEQNPGNQRIEGIAGEAVWKARKSKRAAIAKAKGESQ